MIFETEHFKWGQGCHGWWLHRTPNLTVIRELMPPQTEEKRHKHASAEQYFYCLSGLLSIELDGELLQLGAGQGVSIAPGISHKVRNAGQDNLEFLVVSSPDAQIDRADLE